MYVVSVCMDVYDQPQGSVKESADDGGFDQFFCGQSGRVVHHAIDLARLLLGHCIPLLLLLFSLIVMSNFA